MNKASLNGITTILPFDPNYIKVELGGKWNLMDSEGNLISKTWFTSISKNKDGSIVTSVKHGRGRAKAVEVKFISLESLAKTVDVIGVIPTKCIDFLDSGSIEPIKDETEKYVAKAKLYGRTVYVSREGGIFDGSGTQLRLLFNTVDSERLYRAINDLNRRLRYDCKLLELNGSNNSTYEQVSENHISMWGFYWVTEDWSVKTDFQELVIGTVTKKWTDSLVLRAFEKLPSGALEKLRAKFGEGKRTQNDNDPPVVSWFFNKEDLEKVIDGLNSI